MKRFHDRARERFYKIILKKQKYIYIYLFKATHTHFYVYVYESATPFALASFAGITFGLPVPVNIAAWRDYLSHCGKVPLTGPFPSNRSKREVQKLWQLVLHMFSPPTGQPSSSLKEPVFSTPSRSSSFYLDEIARSGTQA